MDKKVNVTKVLSTISNSKNGEAFDALFGGDIERAGNNVDSAAKSVINTLAWYLNGDADAVAEVFASSALAEQIANAGAIVIKACTSLKSGFAGSGALYGEDNEDAFEERPTRKKATEKLGLSDVVKWLADNNVTVRYNRMTHMEEYKGLPDDIEAGALPSVLPNIIYDSLKDDFTSVNETQISSSLSTIAASIRNQYHPALDYLNSLPAWDGVDRFAELWEMMRINAPTADNLFSQALIKAWMRQSVAILHNGEDGVYFGCLGVLTLSGGQRIGKTNLLRALAMRPEFFGESQRLSNNDKDTERRCLGYWIPELGELDCTFKSDIGYLKGFITRHQDAYRLPYARRDTSHPRLSSLAATVNGDQYLVDPTGNSRFWTVPLRERMDIAGILAYDFTKLWAQTIAEIKASGKPWATCYLLTPDQEDMLNERNSKAEKGIKGEAEIVDILQTHGNKATWEWTTVTKFRDNFKDDLRNYSSEQIGAVLRKLDVERKSKRIDGVCVRAYLLPTSNNSYYLDMSGADDPAPNYGTYDNRDTNDDIPF